MSLRLPQFRSRIRTWVMTGSDRVDVNFSLGGQSTLDPFTADYAFSLVNNEYKRF